MLFESFGARIARKDLVLVSFVCTIWDSSEWPGYAISVEITYEITRGCKRSKIVPSLRLIHNYQKLTPHGSLSRIFNIRIPNGVANKIVPCRNETTDHIRSAGRVMCHEQNHISVSAGIISLNFRICSSFDITHVVGPISTSIVFFQSAERNGIHEHFIVFFIFFCSCKDATPTNCRIFSMACGAVSARHHVRSGDYLQCASRS